MTDADHAALAEKLHAVRGMVMVSGYACELYDRTLYAGWRRLERVHRADGAKRRVEVLWLNPAAAAATPVRSFGFAGGGA
jgi:DNA adenine methylase